MSIKDFFDSLVDRPNGSVNCRLSEKSQSNRYLSRVKKSRLEAVSARSVTGVVFVVLLVLV